MKTLKLNLGCGLQCPEGWVNIDSSIGVRLSKMPLLNKILHSVIPKSLGILPNVNWPKNTMWMELTKPFKFSNGSVDYIYSSHTFEHLTYAETTFVLSECYRILKPGGIVRIIVPDFESLVNNYIGNKISNPSIAAFKFLKDSLYFEIPIPNSLFSFIKFYFQRKNNHAFLYDEAGLKFQFQNSGFVNVSRKQYNDSAIPEINIIELESRVKGALCIEAFKPL